jgi:hypothetical protein
MSERATRVVIAGLALELVVAFVARALGARRGVRGWLSGVTR